MTVFKTFWKVVKKYKVTVLLYTIILVSFGTINMTTTDNQMNFVESKPDILIINNDTNNKVTNNLVKYLNKNTNIINIKNNESTINDALFYRDVNYIIYIPKNYGQNILAGHSPKIEIKQTGDYQASLANMLLTRYLKVQNIYKKVTNNEASLIAAINNNLSKSSNIKIKSKLNTASLSNVSTYFSFASYSLMAVIIYVICIIIASFKDQNINKRTIVSSMSYKTYNRQLLISSLIYTILVFLLYTILGLIILKDIMFTTRGLIYILNSFIFSLCCLTIALLISTIVRNKDAISGIVNVIALGSSFLCGAFVPAEYLPKSVLTIAKIIPTYWYINTNDLLKTIEVINLQELKPIFINLFTILAFSCIFLIINNIISKAKQKVA